MTRKMHLLTALLFASGVIAQPAEPAGAGRSEMNDIMRLNDLDDRYSVRWVKGEKAPFKKPDWQSATQEVWITGQLFVIDDRMDDVELLIDVENGQCQSARIKKNGRFDVLLPAGAKARMIFQKPEHIAKEVVVDASDLDRKMFTRGEDRRVDFDVILIPEEHYPGFMHDGPVGSITFRQGTTVLKVQHHETLVAAERLCTRTK